MPVPLLHALLALLSFALALQSWHLADESDFIMLLSQRWTLPIKTLRRRERLRRIWRIQAVLWVALTVMWIGFALRLWS